MMMKATPVIRETFLVQLMMPSLRWARSLLEPQRSGRPAPDMFRGVPRTECAVTQPPFASIQSALAIIGLLVPLAGPVGLVLSIAG